MPVDYICAQPNYVIRIELKECRPTVWREINVPSDMSLSSLHKVIQVAMGWSNLHLHVFSLPDSSIEFGRHADYSSDTESSEDEMSAFDEAEQAAWYAQMGIDMPTKKRPDKNHTVAELFKHVGCKADYIYDFSDLWEHTLELMDIIRNPHPTPRCIAGEHQCPPESCGGRFGYEAMMLIFNADSQNRSFDRNSWRIGRGYRYDVVPFDLIAVNQTLKTTDISFIGKS
ncbi:hypothetical protein SARC_03557 [Sphaeroforma arctica JP610]|uniref:Plasmid pRiA4b Orf3-like domain-containing protein n=1 Tax=Sphaeroforma arctica JP610 TaxID=667725 RepID=A0A0L0G5B7_9EUKA|nr:hypothetical protein SARC_03557 [Sphaeroforma arctica JP610]KNC84225.1 hypothetical protein SARC_03557 [Sphaeroforma arctica JP610]|eukprot:XP_014158127.1 hypothetical protein SARC_03557 [Sphaeroforma arctica JP610]